MKETPSLSFYLPVEKVKQIAFAILLGSLFVAMSLWLLEFSALTTQAAEPNGGGVVVSIGSVTETRFNEDWTLDGIEMTSTRAKLLSWNNFGPTGTVGFAFSISDTAETSGSIDLALLNNFDLFFIGWFDDGNVNAFTDTELIAMENWVQAGGQMIVTCDDGDHDAVCAHFGYPSVGTTITSVTPTAAGMIHPLFDGPFGVVTTATMEGDMGYFSTTVGAEVLAVDHLGRPVVIQKMDDVGCGAVILMSDIDLITDYGGITPGDVIATNNDRFLGNLFAYMGSFASSCTQFIPAMFSP